MKISELAINAILKKGLLYEGKDVEIDSTFPVKDPSNEKETTLIRVVFKAENMTIRLEKGE